MTLENVYESQLSSVNHLGNWSANFKIIRPIIEKIFSLKTKHQLFERCFSIYINARITELFIDLVVKEVEAIVQIEPKFTFRCKRVSKNILKSN